MEAVHLSVVSRVHLLFHGLLRSVGRVRLRVAVLRPGERQGCVHRPDRTAFCSLVHKLICVRGLGPFAMDGAVQDGRSVHHILLAAVSSRQRLMDRHIHDGRGLGAGAQRDGVEWFHALLIQDQRK